MPKEEMHTVTEEDIKVNPELISEGINVGDEIGIPVEEIKEEA